MADVVTLTAPYYYWCPLLANYRAGKLRKADVVKVLRDGIAPPPELAAEVMAMVADIVEGTGKSLQNGRRQMDKSMRRYFAQMVEGFQDVIANPETYAKMAREAGEPSTIPQWVREAHKRTTYKRRKDHATAREQAKAIVAGRAGVKVRTVEGWLREFGL